MGDQYEHGRQRAYNETWQRVRVCLYLLGYPNSLTTFPSSRALLRRFNFAGNNNTCLGLHVKCRLIFCLISTKLSLYSDSLRAGRSGDTIPVGREVFRTRPDRPWGPPSLLYNGYRVFPGGKAARAWC